MSNGGTYKRTRSREARSNAGCKRTRLLEPDADPGPFGTLSIERITRQMNDAFPPDQRTICIHYCVLMEENDTYGFLLPDSTYNLRFVHATSEMKIVTRTNDRAGLPEDSELVRQISPEYSEWRIPDHPARRISCSSHILLHPDTIRLARLIYLYKIVYIKNITASNYNLLHKWLLNLVEFVSLSHPSVKTWRKA